MKNFDPAMYDETLYELTGQAVRKGCYTLQALIALGLVESGVEKSIVVAIAKRITARIREHTHSLPKSEGATIETQAVIEFVPDDPNDGGCFLLIDWTRPEDARRPEYVGLPVE